MRRLSREVAAKLSIVLKCVLTFKQHFELGRRPRQPAYPGKVDRESECGSSWSNQAGSVGPPDRRAFLFSDFIIDPATIQAYLETHYRVRGEAPFVLQIGQISPDLLSLYERPRCTRRWGTTVRACHKGAFWRASPGHRRRMHRRSARRFRPES